MSADHTFLHGPRQPSFVGFEAAGDELLLFGEGGLGRFLRLFAHHLIDLAVELVHFLLFLFDLLVQVLLLALQLIQHVLLLALVALQVRLLALTGGECRLFVRFVVLQQLVLGIYLRLRVLDAAHLLLAEVCKLLQVACAAGELLKTVARKEKQQGRLLHPGIMALTHHLRVVGFIALQDHL